MQKTTTQPLVAGLPAGHQIGLIRWFDNRSDKQFGFITTGWNNSKEEDIFFHLNDNVALIKGEDQPVFGSHPLGKPPRKPEIGDVVIFRTGVGRRGPKASPWVYWKDWEAVSLYINPQPLYRVIGDYPRRPGANHDPGQVFWSGTCLEVFYLKYPDCREDIDYIREYHRFTDNVTDVRFEKLPAGVPYELYTLDQWERFEPCTPTSEHPELQITACYGLGGHEFEYVVQLWVSQGVYQGQHDWRCVDIPSEFGRALEGLCEVQPIRWSASDRGSRIEVYHIAVKRGVVESFESRTSFSPNHPEMERLIREALQKVEKDLEKIRIEKTRTGYEWADVNTSPFIRNRNLTFNVAKIEVS